MATTPSSSTLANLAARRQAIQKTRVAIGLSSGGAPNGGMRAGAPVNGPGPASPTPDQPAVTAAPTAGAPMDALHPDNVPEMKTREQALAYTKQMLDTQRNQGRPVTPAAPVNQPPASAAPPVLDAIRDAGAEQMSPVAQFMRLAGRNPSGREMAMFAATTELARQLGRNPTSNELMIYMTQPRAEASPISIPGVNS